MFQSLNRAYKRSDRADVSQVPSEEEVFQSLNRAYKRSDNIGKLPKIVVYLSFNPSIGLTSVPTINTRLISVITSTGFNPSIGLTSVPTTKHCSECSGSTAVSIPQSGLQAFRHSGSSGATAQETMFQSLNRAYKRSDPRSAIDRGYFFVVSIPQSGLQAFRHAGCSRRLQSLRSFNPSIGLTSVPTSERYRHTRSGSQVSIPQSGLQAFRHN